MRLQTMRLYNLTMSVQRELDRVTPSFLSVSPVSSLYAYRMTCVYVVIVPVVNRDKRSYGSVSVHKFREDIFG